MHCLGHTAVMHHPNPLSERQDRFPRCWEPSRQAALSCQRGSGNTLAEGDHLAQGQAGLFPGAAHIQWQIDLGTVHLNPAPGNSKRPPRLDTPSEDPPSGDCMTVTFSQCCRLSFHPTRINPQALHDTPKCSPRRTVGCWDTSPALPSSSTSK